MKLVTFDQGQVGRVEDEETIVELDVPSMREYFERGGDVAPTGRQVALSEAKLQAPVVPKKV